MNCASLCRMALLLWACSSGCGTERMLYEPAQAWVQLGEESVVYLEVELDPLELSAWRAGNAELSLAVRVENRMDEPLSVVTETVKLTDHGGRELERLEFRPAGGPDALVAPGERTRFEARFAAPPEGGTYGNAVEWTLSFDLQHPEGRLAAEAVICEEWPFPDETGS